MNRNSVLNSPDDITEDLLKRIINNDLDSLTINYEFAYTYNDEIESQKDRSELLKKNPFIMANRIKALRRIEFEVILTPAVHSLSHAFENMYRLEYVNIKDTSNITDMSCKFQDDESFNQPLNDWDTSKVTSMHGMFMNAESFNQPLDRWNTSHVTDMSFMFKGAVSFNQLLNSWDTSAVADMSHMFRMAKSFNQPVKCWNTASVKDFSGMFCGAVSFRQPIWENQDKRKVCHADFENNEGVLESVENRLSEDYTLDVYIHEPLFIDEIINGKKAVTIRWSGCRGYGEYTICKNKDIDSEYMESDYDRSFAISILKILRKEHQTENIKRHLDISCDLETFVLKECRISDYKTTLLGLMIHTERKSATLTENLRIMTVHQPGKSSGRSDVSFPEMISFIPFENTVNFTFQE